MASNLLFYIILLFTMSTATESFTLRPGGEFPENMRKINISYIIEGWPAEQTQFPHQVYLRTVTYYGSLSGCGGTLISPKWVVTAAHCLVDKAIVIVRLGNINTTTPGLVIESWNFYTHEDFDRSNLNNDIGIISLGRYVHTTDHIKPIRLPRISEATKTWENAIATASGWGTTTDYGGSAETLHFVNLKVISNPDCEEIYGPEWIINSTLCGSGALNDSQGMCFGDSGGPLIAFEEDGLPTLIGIVSFVNNILCSAPYPSGFLRPGHFLEWIAEHTGEELRP